MLLKRKHPLTKRLRALREKAAQRESERCFVAEGFHLVQEALASGARIELVVTAPELSKHREGPALLEQLAV